MTQYRFIKQVESKVNGYHGTQVSTGNIVELEGAFAAKADNNPDYERFYPGETEVVENSEGTFAEMSEAELEKATAP
jgi:hypothetical protein